MRGVQREAVSKREMSVVQQEATVPARERQHMQPAVRGAAA